MSVDDRIPESGAAPATDPVRDAASPVPPRSRGTGRAAALGGVMGLLGGGLASAIYAYGLDGTTRPGGAPDPAVAALSSRVAAVERAAPQGNSAELGQRLAAAETARTELANRLAALERSSAQPGAAQGSVEELTQRLNAAEAARSELANRLAALEQRPAASESPQAAASESPLAGRIDALEQRLNETAQQSQSRLAEIGSAVAPVEELSRRVAQLGELGPRVEQNERALAAATQRLDQAAGQIGPLRQSVDQISSRLGALDTLSTRVEENARRLGELANVQQRVAAVEQTAPRIAAIEQRLRDQPLDRRAALAVALAALQSAISRGAPFANELATVERLNGQDAALAAIKARAQAGIPTAAALRQQFTAVSDQMQDAQANSQADGALGRLLASAQSAVRVRQTGPVEGSGVGATAARIRTALDEGNLRQALQEWQSLPEPAREASKDWGEALSARVRAEDAIGALATNLAAATAPAGTPPASNTQPAAAQPAASAQPAAQAQPAPAQPAR